MMTVEEAIKKIGRDIRINKRGWANIPYGAKQDREIIEEIRDLEAARRILRLYLKEERRG